MTTFSNSDRFGKPNEDKFNFDEHARALDAQNQFAPLDTPPAIGLRQFLDRETRLQAASSGSNETLIPGKLYLRKQPSGTWEIIRNRGRGSFDCYPFSTREEGLEFFENNFKQE